MKLTVKELTVFGLMAALMYASKMIMEILPNIHLIGVFVVALTVVYRKKALYPIYTFVLLTGVFFGFSAWWIPYLYIWTILWGAVMLLPKNINPHIKPVVYMCLCALHGLLYGTLYAPVHILLYGLNMKAAIAWIVAGIPWDIVHCIGNFFCGALICPIIKALQLADNSSIKYVE